MNLKTSRITRFASFVLALLLAFSLVSPQSAQAAAANVKVERLQGADRNEVATNVEKKFFGSETKVILVNNMAWADAISATNISQGKYPILYLTAAGIPQTTKDALTRIRPSQIYVMGGVNTVKPAVVTELKKYSTTVTRVDGANRYVVSANAARYVPSPRHLIFTTGQVESDALISAPYAKLKSAAILLVGLQFDPATDKYLSSYGKGVSTEIIGGTRYMPKAFESHIRSLTGTQPGRIAGNDRYEVSAQVAAKNFPNATRAFLASGMVFSDALSSSAAAQKLSAPILLTTKTQVSAQITNYFKNNAKLANIYVVGGPNTITQNAVNNMVKVMNGEEPGSTEPTLSPSGKRVVDVSKLPAEVRDRLQTLTQDMDQKGVTEFLAELNKMRANKGIAPLTLDKNLSIEAAYEQMTLQVTGNPPVGGQYNSGDEFYYLSRVPAASRNLMDNVAPLFLSDGGSSAASHIGVARYGGEWYFMFGGNVDIEDNDTLKFSAMKRGTHQPAMADELIAKLNAFRRSQGLNQVKRDPVMDKLTKWRSIEITGLMLHLRPDYKDYAEEFHENPGQVRFIGESLVAGPSVQSMYDQLTGHGPHLHQLVNPNYTMAGVSVYKADDGTLYAAIIWDSPASKYTTSYEPKDLTSYYRYR